METYRINGIDVEYDTFDLANMELFDSEYRRVTDFARKVKDEAETESYLTVLRALCEEICDFFDVVLGEGTAQKLFGGRMNVREITDSYRSFTRDVVAQMGTQAAAGIAAAPAPGNREQRRAALREQRRQEAAVRAREKAQAGE